MPDFLNIIASRRSIRKFDNKKVEKYKIDNIIKAALYAPSGKRTFPARFIVVQDKNTLEQISKSKEHGATFVANAPLAVVAIADTTKYDAWIEDSSIATTYIMLAAENEGLGACWVQMRLRSSANGNTATQNLSNTLSLKTNEEVLAVIAIGYKAENKEAYNDNDLDFDRVSYL